MNATSLVEWIPLLVGLAVFVLVVWRMNRRLRKLNEKVVPPALRFVGDRSGKTSGTSAEAFEVQGAPPAEDKMRDR